jgi:hypothetical protein
MSPCWLWTRAAACWLIALIVFPFSAPLSVCDLADLTPKTTESATAPLSKAPAGSSVVKDALAQAFPLRTTSVRTRRHPSSESWPVAHEVKRTTLPVLRKSTHTANRLPPVTKTVLRI